MNRQSIILENKYLRAVVMPAFGGKISSLVHKKKRFELLFQNQKPYFSPAPLYADFSQFEASGFDDTFPCIDEEDVIIENKTVRYPDHGEIWTACFEYTVNNEKISLYYPSKILDYEYYKTIYLDSDSIICEYTIKNRGKNSFPCIWTAHCLVRYEADMELLYPQGVRGIEMTADSLAPGAKGKKYLFPTDTVEGQKRDFRFPVKTKECYAQKWYDMDRVEEGYCGYLYPSQNMQAELFFDAATLPYLGFWITSGGFRGDYNCAFEPSSGYYDRISIAKSNKRLNYLAPGDTLEFSITIKLTDLKEE